MNLRPSAPKADALPSCAIPRHSPSRHPAREAGVDWAATSAGIRLTPRTRRTHRLSRGRSSMVEPQSSKLATRVRFSSPAPPQQTRSDACLTWPGRSGCWAIRVFVPNPCPIVARLGRLDAQIVDHHPVEGVGDRAVPRSGRVLVDQSRSYAGVTHERHEFAGRRTRGGCPWRRS